MSANALHCLPVCTRRESLINNVKVFLKAFLDACRLEGAQWKHGIMQGCMQQTLVTPTRPAKGDVGG